MDARRPVGAAAALVNGTDARLERLVALPAPRWLADAATHGTRSGRHRALGPSWRYGSGPDSLASPVPSRSPERARAAAFASISRSSCSQRCSRRRRRSSSRWVLASPSSRRPLSRSPWRTQLPMVWSEHSHSPARSRIARPECTSSAIWWRNSGGYGKVGSWHRGFSFPEAKGFGIHESGSTPLVVSTQVAVCRCRGASRPRIVAYRPQFSLRAVCAPGLPLPEIRPRASGASKTRCKWHRARPNPRRTARLPLGGSFHAPTRRKNHRFLAQSVCSCNIRATGSSTSPTGRR